MLAKIDEVNQKFINCQFKGEKFDDFIALNVFLVAVTKRHVSQRPFELEINNGYF